MVSQLNKTLTLDSPAKLNLFLHINSQRADGYHELQTVFQLLDRGDLMHFAANTSGTLQIEPVIEGLKTEDNLIYKAALQLKPYATKEAGAVIRLEKNLPMGGGVGGGSSNAATTLLALNKLWDCQLSLDALAEIGLKLGADVPIFVQGKSAWAEGVGDEIHALKLPENWFVVLTPECHVSTAEIFSNQRLTRDTPKKKIAPASEAWANNAFDNSYRNDCEAIVTELHPEIREAIKWLNQYGNARLTGTGACCFVRLNSEDEAKQVLNEARSKFKGFIAKGVNLSPAHQRLNEAD